MGSEWVASGRQARSLIEVQIKEHRSEMNVEFKVGRRSQRYYNCGSISVKWFSCIGTQACCIQVYECSVSINDTRHAAF